jgi:hypothetical protein
MGATRGDLRPCLSDCLVPCSWKDHYFWAEATWSKRPRCKTKDTMVTGGFGSNFRCSKRLPGPMPAIREAGTSAQEVHVLNICSAYQQSRPDCFLLCGGSGYARDMRHYLRSDPQNPGNFREIGFFGAIAVCLAVPDSSFRVIQRDTQLKK